MMSSQVKLVNLHNEVNWIFLFKSFFFKKIKSLIWLKLFRSNGFNEKEQQNYLITRENNTLRIYWTKTGKSVGNLKYIDITHLW